MKNKNKEPKKLTDYLFDFPFAFKRYNKTTLTPKMQEELDRQLLRFFQANETEGTEVLERDVMSIILDASLGCIVDVNDDTQLLR